MAENLANSKKLTRSEQKHQQIFDAAVIEFMAHGYKAASMDAIATRASVSKRTVYNHFANKEALFNAIIARTLSADNSFDFSFDSSKDLHAQLKGLALVYIAAITNEDYIRLSRVVVSEFVRDPVAAQQAFAQFNAHDQAVVAFMAAAMQAGKLRKVEPRYASTQFLALLKAFTYSPTLIGGLTLPSEAQISEMVDDSIAMFLTYYAVAP